MSPIPLGIFAASGFGQSPYYLLSLPSAARVSDFDYDLDGNLYYSGGFGGSAFMAKTDPTGNLVFQKTLSATSGYNNVYFDSVAVDRLGGTGNVFLSGESSTRNSSSSDIFIAKSSSSGVFQNWSALWDSTYSTYASFSMDIEIDTSATVVTGDYGRGWNLGTSVLHTSQLAQSDLSLSSDYAFGNPNGNFTYSGKSLSINPSNGDRIMQFFPYWGGPSITAITTANVQRWSTRNAAFGGGFSSEVQATASNGTYIYYSVKFSASSPGKSYIYVVNPADGQIISSRYIANSNDNYFYSIATEGTSYVYTASFDYQNRIIITKFNDTLSTVIWSRSFTRTNGNMVSYQGTGSSTIKVDELSGKIYLSFKSLGNNSDPDQMILSYPTDGSITGDYSINTESNAVFNLEIATSSIPARTNESFETNGAGGQSQLNRGQVATYPHTENSTAYSTEIIAI
jgi:hypothetical protein